MYMSTTTAYSRKVLFFLILLVSLALAGWLVYHETRVPQNETEVQNRVLELQKEGRYDKAVEVIRKWMSDNRRDPSHDESFLRDIAMTYFMKAWKNPTSRDASIQESALNLEKALELLEKNKPDGIQLDLYEIGRNYEELGNLSLKNKCQYYEKARSSYVRQLPVIAGESYSAYGKTFHLEPIRKEIRNHLEATETKLVQTGCPANPGTQEK